MWYHIEILLHIENEKNKCRFLKKAIIKYFADNKKLQWEQS